MPTYSYACKECGHRFDINQAFTDDALTVCPECGGVLRKVWGSVGVVFKGSGFYRNDSRSAQSSSSPAAPNKDGAKSDGAKSDGAKSDGAKSGSGKPAGAGSSTSSGAGSAA